MAPRAIRQENMVMSPAGLGTKSKCAGEDQQQFTRPDQTKSVFKALIMLLLSWAMKLDKYTYQFFFQYVYWMVYFI
jgi:hypothetical protein